MANQFGPWATWIDAGSSPQLSTFWQRRLTMLLPVSQTSFVLSRRNVAWLGITGAMLFVLPTLRPAPLVADDQKPADKGVATITGRVMRKDNGQPLAGALVRAAVPAMDMRFLRCDSKQPRYETRTDQRGQYRLAVPVDAPDTCVSLDAFSPGFQSAAGLYMMYTPASKVTVSPHGTATCDFKLSEATYVAGVLVNQNGEGVEGALVCAHLNTARSSGGVTRVLTDKNGRFEIFDYPKEQPKGEDGWLGVEHTKYCTIGIKDIYALPQDQRRNLRLVATKGRTIEGRLLDADGKPAADVMVEADFPEERKATVSGRDGGFGLYGLPNGKCTILAHSLNLRQKIKQPLSLDHDITNLALMMSRIETPSQPRPITLFGMKLVDATPALQDEYDLFHDRGVLILAPGPNHARLQIGNLVEGDCFVMAGNYTNIRNIKDFVAQLLGNVKRQSDGSGTCRVVYSLRRVNLRGSNTQYIKLTAADLKELEAVAKQFAIPKP